MPSITPTSGGAYIRRRAAREDAGQGFNEQIAQFRAARDKHVAALAKLRAR